MNRPLSEHEVAANLRPHGSVDNLQTSASLRADEPAGDPPVGSHTSFRGGLLRAAAIDAIHSYLVYSAGYNLSAVAAPLNRVAQCMEAHATTLGREARTGQDTP